MSDLLSSWAHALSYSSDTIAFRISEALRLPASRWLRTSLQFVVFAIILAAVLAVSAGLLLLGLTVVDLFRS